MRIYWKKIQERPAYRKGRAVGLDEKLDKIKTIIDDWKKEHAWFRKKIYNQCDLFEILYELRVYVST